MSMRSAWKKSPTSALPYVCPRCKRDKGMLYLFPDRTLSYVCFCGSSIAVDWIKDRYHFQEKAFKNEIQYQNHKPSDNDDYVHVKEEEHGNR